MLLSGIQTALTFTPTPCGPLPRLAGLRPIN